MSRAAVHPYFQAIVTADITKSSKRLYVRNLQTLCRTTGMTLEEIVHNPKKTYIRIRKWYDNTATRRNMLGAIRALFKHVPNLQCQFEAQSDLFNTYFTHESSKIEAQVMSGQPTDRERDNWVRWEDVVEKEQELAASRYASTEHLLLAMYVLIEPARQDYYSIQLVTKEPDDTSKKNYIILPSSTLVLNEYKTAKAYSTYRRILPENLMAIIRESIRQQPRQFLFVQQKDNQPYTRRNTFTKFTNRILEKLFDRNFTVGMIRHCYISEGLDFNEATPGEVFQAAKHMHHSVAQQQLYRRKVTDDVAPPPSLAENTTHDVVQVGRNEKIKEKPKAPNHQFREQHYIDVSF